MLRLLVVLILINLALTLNEVNKLELFNFCIESNGLAATDFVFTQNSTNSSLYAKLDYRWTTRPEHIHPLGYFVPSSTQNVQIGVRCARQVNLRVIPKSGGHSAELYSFGSAETLVISMQNLNQIQINKNETTAVIGAGATLGQIRQELWNNGEFGIPAGICSEVGIGGQVLGGGQGYLTPMFGLTMDNVVEMEMVDANGDAHVVNEFENEDLFWALRGSGSGFIGIVTKIKFKLFKASNVKSSVVTLNYDSSQVSSVLDAYQTWMKFTIDERLNISSLMSMGFGDPALSLKITLLENSNSDNSGTQDFFKFVKSSFPPTKNASINFPPYMDLKGNVLSTEDSRVPMYAKIKSFYVDQFFNSSQFEIIGQSIRNISNCQAVVYLEGYGGKFGSIRPTESAFVHRNNLYLVSVRILGVEMSEGQIKEAKEWFNRFISISKFMDNGQSYQNYVDADWKDYMTRYYGTNAHRLITIKQKWDPLNYFQNPQSIPIG